jgi:hypothetical protein
MINTHTHDILKKIIKWSIERPRIELVYRKSESFYSWVVLWYLYQSLYWYNKDIFISIKWSTSTYLFAEFLWIIARSNFQYGKYVACILQFKRYWRNGITPSAFRSKRMWHPITVYAGNKQWKDKNKGPHNSQRHRLCRWWWFLRSSTTLLYGCDDFDADDAVAKDNTCCTMKYSPNKVRPNSQSVGPRRCVPPPPLLHC